MKMYNDDLETDAIGTGTHEKRYAKVTMYLEVDSVKTDLYGRMKFKTDDEILQQIERNVKKHGITLSSFSDIILSPIEGDNPCNFKKPVGYLTYTGNFFLLEGEDYGLAHVALSSMLYQYYEDFIKERRIYGTDLENTLEHMGMIKVHGCGFRYYPSLPYSGYHDQKDCKTPKINEVQRLEMIKYLENKYPNEQWVEINGKSYKIRDFKQMDLVRINEIFNFENDD